MIGVLEPPGDRPPVRPGDILGVPFLPPGAVTAGANRVRDLVDRTSGAIAPPPVRILEGLFGLLDHRVLVVLCDAGVPDALDGPVELGVLATRLRVDAERLERVLRFAAARGWVRLDRKGRVAPTAVTRFLRRDHPGGWRAWVEFAGGDEIVAAVSAMSVAPDGIDGFAAGNGAPFFEWMADHPDRWRVFDRAMAAGGRMHALTLAAALDWSASRRVCDVGGGTGDLLVGLLDLLPDLEGTVFDLAPVVARAVTHPRLDTLAGDAFVSVPPGFDSYLLINVLHDWGDADAGRILAAVGGALSHPDTPREARVVVVDADRAVVPRDRLGAGADMLMATLTNGGKERDEQSFRRLGARQGLRLTRAHRLASGDRAFEFRPGG